ATQEVNRLKSFRLLQGRFMEDRRPRSGRGAVRAHDTIPLSPAIVSAIPSAFSGLDGASATADEMKGGASLPGPARPPGFEKPEGRRAEGDKERVPGAPSRGEGGRPRRESIVEHRTSANQCSLLSRLSTPVRLISRQKGDCLARCGPPHLQAHR